MGAARPSASSSPTAAPSTFVALAAFAALAVASCGGGTKADEPPLETSDDVIDPLPNGSPGDGVVFGDGGTTSQAGGECGEGSREIQFLGAEIAADAPGGSSGLAVWRFAPATSAFTKVADVRCEGAAALPRVTAGTGVVDRRGQAYVHLAGRDDEPNGEGAYGLYRVDTATGACTRLAGDRPSSLTLGSAFATGGFGVTAETWFVLQPKFGVLDPSTLVAREIAAAAWLPAGAVGQLLGSGDGTLRGLAWVPGVDRPISLHVLDKATGAAVAETVALDASPLRGASAWSFTLWGGETWAFVGFSGASANESGSQVVRWDAKGSAAVVARHPTLRVGAASASTCAPTAPVR